MDNKYKTITRPSNPSLQHNSKTPKICYYLHSKTRGEKGGWVDNSTSNESPNKFYQAKDL